MDLLKESPLWQYISEQGEIQGIREMLIDLGRDRFGRLPKATRAAIEAIDDLKRIKHLTRRVLTATSWDDLLSGASRATRRRSPPPSSAPGI